MSTATSDVSFLHKIQPPLEAARTLSAWPSPVVFTNGVFDVLHKGHVCYLDQARALGTHLVVAINTDASVKRLGKGLDRPFNPLADRLLMLAALASVDVVTWFDENTPCEVITQLRPHILTKGGDYDMAQLPETRLLESWGGRALALPFVAGYSTTRFVEKIRDSNGHTPPMVTP
jgi:rfaE bifunctional protein nucleotidyltransferase chain/domain